MTVGQAYAHHLVALVDIDGDDTIGTRTAVCLQTGLLDNTVLGGEYHIMGIDKLRVIEVLDAQYGIDGVIRLDIQHVLDGASLRVLVTLRNLIALLPVAAALLGEEEQCVMYRGRIDILREVVVTMACRLGADTTPALLMELI